VPLAPGRAKPGWSPPLDSCPGCRRTSEGARAYIYQASALAHPDEGVRVYVVCGVLLGGAVAVQHFLSVVVFHPRLIAQDFVVRGLQQLLTPVTQL
jgi:hypothetical protein